MKAGPALNEDAAPSAGYPAFHGFLRRAGWKFAHSTGIHQSSLLASHRSCCVATSETSFCALQRPNTVSISHPDIAIPRWLQDFASDAAGQFSAGLSIAPIGCHYAIDQDSSTWEVTLFVSRTEIRGGENDGQQLPSLLTVDINGVCGLFDQSPSVYLQAIEFDDKADPGTFLSFLGSCSGHRVWLRVPAKPPRWAGTGRVQDAATGHVRDIW
jgi:hypothetical protein